MKIFRRVLASIVGAACLSGAFMWQEVMAAAGAGAGPAASWCTSGEACIATIAWVRVSGGGPISSVGGDRRGGFDGGGSRCDGYNLYFLAKIWYSPSEGYFWAGAQAMSGAAAEMHVTGYDFNYKNSGVMIDGTYGISTGGSGEIVNYAFNGSASFVPLPDAEYAFNNAEEKDGKTWSVGSNLGWFCWSGGGTVTQTPTTSTPTITQTPEEKKEWEDRKTNYDGEAKVDYMPKGSETKSGDKVTVWNQWDPISADPKFEHCLRVTSGAPPASSGLDASTQWRVSGDGSGGGGMWGHSNYPSSCMRVSGPTTVTKTTELGKEIKICQRLGYYATVKWQVGRSYTEDASGNKTYTSDWIYYRLVGRENWTEKEACITFYHPYMYIDYEDTYKGKVTGKTEAAALGCDGIVAEDGGNEKRECFIKSSVPAGTMGGDSDAEAKTYVKFQDEISRSTTVIQDKHNDEGRKGQSFSLNSDPGTQWQTEGITNGSGEDRDGVVRSFNENSKLVGALGYRYLDQHNNFKWDKVVKWVLRSDGKRGMVVRSGRGEAQVGFDVYHPYNYDTSAEAEITNTDLFVGQTGTAKVGARYLARANKPVTGDETTSYQTALPAEIGKYYAIFTVPADAGVDSVRDITEETTSVQRTAGNVHDLCVALDGHVGGFVRDKCQSNEIVTDEININVPDEVGVKVCVVAGVNYADSHGKSGGVIQPEDDKNGDAVPDAGRGELMINSDYWKVSGVACETVKAKPRMQNWNAGFYTEGTVKMSVEKKVPGQVFSVGGPGEQLGFGSWSETSFIQGGNSAGFASSSKLGGTGMSGYSFCNSSPVSVANVGTGAACSDLTSSELIDSKIASATTDTVNKTLARYIPSGLGGENKDGDLASVGGVVPGRYEYYADDTKIPGRTVDFTANSTQVIIVRGTATITGNICIGTGGCESGGELVVRTRNMGEISDIRTLANVVIIADEIRIDANVTQIDATLMALGTGGVANRLMGSDGAVNTCGTRSNGNDFVRDDMKKEGDTKMDDAAIGACKRTLLVNGPVFAGKLIPNRTKYEVGAGANITADINLEEMGSSTAAEVFNLNPYVYMWAFEQASRYTQAGTVYTEELAPRL